MRYGCVVLQVTEEEAMKEAWRIVKHGRQRGRNPWLAAEDPHKFVLEVRNTS
jgi:hypothetical protein